MNKKLFLTSAGLPIETRKYFVNLLVKKAEDIKVCFIPTAAYPEVIQMYIDQAKEELREIGIKQIDNLDLRDENKESLLNKLFGYDVIYVNGGNTFYLLYWVKKSGFDQILPQLLKQGKVYVGVSAGSIITGPNIEVAGWGEEADKNIVNLQDFSGLNLVPFAVSPHFTENDRKVLEDESKLVSYPIIALGDTQAVLVKDSDVKIVGEGEIVVFNNNGEIIRS